MAYTSIMEERDLSYLRQFIENANTDISFYKKNKGKRNFNYCIKENDVFIAGIEATDIGFGVVNIKNIFVIEEGRRLGFGKALVEIVLNEARSKGINIVRVNTFSFQASDFFEHIGFKKIGEYYENTNDFKEVFFFKKL